MENITVCVRVRPKNHEDCLWKLEGNSLIVNKNKEMFSYGKFGFNGVDKIFDTTKTNEDIFNSTVKESIESFLKGINVSIFAYGQTSTGKTHTMKGEESNPGIMRLAIRHIFRRLADGGYTKCSLKVSNAY
jgi:centromeric protein E